MAEKKRECWLSGELDQGMAGQGPEGTSWGRGDAAGLLGAYAAHVCLSELMS
jgi:hypothetical protein